jgi:hypothetical protein
LTLILTHKQRLDATYGQIPAAGVMSSLETLAEHLSVKGIVIPVESSAVVSDTYALWNADYCDERRSNGVAAAIRSLVASYLQQYPAIQYIVIAGSDEIIPFYRVPDHTRISPESDFAIDSLTAFDNPTFRSLAHNFILTDDFYGDDNPLLWRGRRLFVPDRAIGRLVERPADIIAAVDNYLALETISLSRSLVTGYDFLIDSGEAISSVHGSFGLTPRTLIDDSWTVDDLKAEWTSANPRPDLVSVNAHFEHWRALPADGSQGLFDNTYITSTNNYTHQIAYSMGCHAGLSVPDRRVSYPPSTPDFPQAFAQQDAAAWVANTGFGYGMDDAIALSEQLMLFFTRELGAGSSVPIGGALMNAKRRYVGSAPSGGFSVYDEKSLIEATLYGLPMRKVSVPNPQPPGVQSIDALQAGGAGWSQGQPFFVSNNLQGVTVSVQLTPAQEMAGPNVFWSLDGEVQGFPGRPVQPRATTPAADVPRFELRGLLLMRAIYSDAAGINPLVTRAALRGRRLVPGQVLGGEPLRRSGAAGGHRRPVQPERQRRAPVSGPRARVLLHDRRDRLPAADNLGDTCRPCARRRRVHRRRRGLRQRRAARARHDPRAER